MPILKETQRYAQQIKLEQLGLEGQERLRQARVLCVGAGGLGSSLLMYLAAAGIGKLGIVDADVVDESNLQRQILYQQRHVHQKKVYSAQAQLQALNPLIEVQAYDVRLTRENAEQLIAEYDVVADCTDNFATRYLIHELCFRMEKPYVYASAYKFLGHCSLFYGKQAPCLCCLFPTVSNAIGTCQDGGVLGVVPGMLGIIQASEIIKFIVGMGTTLEGRLLVIDLLTMNFKEIQLVKQQDCPLCVQGLTVEQMGAEIDAFGVKQDDLVDYLRNNPECLLLDVRTFEEHKLQNIGGVLIPLSELASRLCELNPAKAVLVYCQSGARSIQALNLLVQAGFQQVRFLVGGIGELTEMICII